MKHIGNVYSAYLNSKTVANYHIGYVPRGYTDLPNSARDDKISVIDLSDNKIISLNLDTKLQAMKHLLQHLQEKYKTVVTHNTLTLTGEVTVHPLDEKHDVIFAVHHKPDSVNAFGRVVAYKTTDGLRIKPDFHVLQEVNYDRARRGIEEHARNYVTAQRVRAVQKGLQPGNQNTNTRTL